MKIVAIGLLLALTACTTTQTDNAKNQVAAMESALAAAETLAAAYVNLPTCTGTGTQICSNASIIATVGKSDGIAYAAIVAAQKTVDDVSATAGSINQAVTAASDALTAFQSIVQALPQKQVQQ